ncbi:MAG: M20/M25/M40 family metallo-hydrolase [Betaproteobacteria bacterium]|nr:M20/M25/M40 family metallo-hydrolase [Betaproteobacteria bacterium]
MSAGALRRHVEVLAGEIGERNVQRPEALRAAERYIAHAWANQGFDVAPQRYTAAGVDCANLEVVIPGTSLSDEIIVVGAHYDTVAGSPGADDNASAVAALIEIARLASRVRPERTLKLVAFVNEEAPFFYWGDMGSGVYAKAARRRGDDIRAMFSLEMLGCYSDAPGSQTYPPLLKYFYPDRGDFIAFVSNLRSRRMLRAAIAAFRASSRFPCESAALPAWIPGVGWSDQLSFWRAGYPGVMVTDTAFHRYPHYHCPTDTPEKLDYLRLAQVTEGLAGAFLRLARR